ncbi:alpha/beta fold hydrolase [Tsukamurella soli]|uniref:alpha/beta fold hydrolase n=1 Tax=Tsukamurella soli TaxID=644556 RepID=UPI003CD07A0A
MFVHGIRLSGGCWTQQIRLSHGRRAATPDLPGHGRRRGEAFSAAGAVDAIVEAIDEVGGHAVVVGHSLGGSIAIATAARNPDRVAAVVASGCTLVPNMWLRGIFRLGHGALSRLPDRGAGISANALRRSLPDEIAKPTIAAGIASEVIPEVMDAAADIDSIDDLGAYPGHVLFLNGGHDAFRLGERRFLAASRDGALQIVPGAGHYVPLTHGETFARAVRAVADRCDTATRNNT